MKIKELTICLHCGCNKEIVFRQIDSLSSLEDKYKIYWNNRIDRFPYAYPSYSKLINHSIVTSPTEYVIMINDRTSPKPEEVEKIINLLENMYSCVFMYNVGFMGFSKKLIKKIGWWDERFLNGGWEDVDWVYRLKMNNLSLYESCESTYDYSWKSPLQNNDQCKLSYPHFMKKYEQKNNIIIKKIKEENYNYTLENLDNEELPWKTWEESILNINYSGPGKGIATSERLKNKIIIEE
jgi:hypothetical protein